MSSEVGRKIKAIRISLGYSMEMFGQLFVEPATKGTVSKWESGAYIPNAERLKRIADVGNITVEELLNGSREQAIQELIAFTREFVECYGHYAIDAAFETDVIGTEEEEERILTAKKQEFEELVKRIGD